jgi:hypothetical protein
VPQLKDDWQKEIRSLKQGWNTYKAPPITEEAIVTLESFWVTPTNFGGLQLEFHMDRLHFELEIGPSGMVLGFNVNREEEKHDS